MWGEMSGIGDGGMVATNHLAMDVPMQQSCMICTCTPESKVQFKKRERKKFALPFFFFSPRRSLTLLPGWSAME